MREMRRFKQALSKEEIDKLLIEEKRGFLGVYGLEGYPYTVPMNYIYLNDKIYLHCSKEGHKLEAIKENNHVSFTIIDKGTYIEDDWFMHVNSVIIFGSINIIENVSNYLDIIKAFGMKYFPTEELVINSINKNLEKMYLLELNIDHISGKRVKEK